jgi:prepilin-type N-terminal cleavage/methylation domain-containing protein
MIAPIPEDHLFRLHRQQGFTLVEIAIVLVIIGFLLAGILNAQSVLRNARTKDTIKAVTDMANATQQFRDRYGNWPGALQNAVAVIPSLNPACVGNVNGVIASAAESACASEELIRSSMLRGTAGSPITLNGVVTISVTGAGAALSGVAGLPANWRNVVRVQAIDCDVALQIDRSVDDGSLITGNFRSATVCPAQNEAILVANAVLRLN